MTFEHTPQLHVTRLLFFSGSFIVIVWSIPKINLLRAFLLGFDRRSFFFIMILESEINLFIVFCFLFSSYCSRRCLFDLVGYGYQTSSTPDHREP